MASSFGRMPAALYWHISPSYADFSITTDQSGSVVIQAPMFIDEFVTRFQDVLAALVDVRPTFRGANQDGSK